MSRHPFHPWRLLRSRPHLRLLWADLPPHLHGIYRGDGTIVLARDLLQVERRCTIAHELVHDERGVPHGVCDPAEEARVAQEAAHRLIPLELLVDALRWSRQPDEVAEELWVTTDVLRTRVEHLHPSERHTLRAALGHDVSHRHNST